MKNAENGICGIDIGVKVILGSVGGPSRALFRALSGAVLGPLRALKGPFVGPLAPLEVLYGPPLCPFVTKRLQKGP